MMVRAKKQAAVNQVAQITPERIRRAYHEAATAYREHRDHVPERGGFVVFWHGQPCGWIEEYEVRGKPGGWDAGCIAVPSDPQDQFYVAAGGDYIRGGERWEEHTIR